MNFFSFPQRFFFTHFCPIFSVYSFLPQMFYVFRNYLPTFVVTVHLFWSVVIYWLVAIVIYQFYQFSWLCVSGR